MRGLAAALTLGAQGVNIGPRFLASQEAEIDDKWKRRILAAESEDAIKVEFANHVFPAPSREGGYKTLPRVLRTAFVEEWNQEWNRRQDEVEQEAERLSRADYERATGQGARAGALHRADGGVDPRGLSRGRDSTPAGR